MVESDHHFEFKQLFDLFLNSFPESALPGV